MERALHAERARDVRRVVGFQQLPFVEGPTSVNARICDPVPVIGGPEERNCRLDTVRFHEYTIRGIATKDSCNHVSGSVWQQETEIGRRPVTSRQARSPPG